MKIDQLKIGSWYSFVNYEGTLFYCSYLGDDFHSKILYLYGGHHVFHFLDGGKYDYDAKGIGTMKPCSESFSRYLNLFDIRRSND